MTELLKNPHCPKCRQPMTLAHVVPRLAVHPEIRSFACRPCGEVVTLVEEK
jgi:hypothetical protein